MWPLLKEVLGFVGAFLLVFPWLRDFKRRMAAARLVGLKAAGSLGKLAEALRNEDENWLARPKPLDLIFTMMGLILLSVSFLIGAFLAWPAFVAG
jgi:hypothetical protein